MTDAISFVPTPTADQRATPPTLAGRRWPTTSTRSSPSSPRRSRTRIRWSRWTPASSPNSWCSSPASNSRSSQHAARDADQGDQLQRRRIAVGLSGPAGGDRLGRRAIHGRHRQLALHAALGRRQDHGHRHRRCGQGALLQDWRTDRRARTTSTGMANSIPAARPPEGQPYWINVVAEDANGDDASRRPTRWSRPSPASTSPMASPRSPRLPASSPTPTSSG